jgi:hypothetical protein
MRTHVPSPVILNSLELQANVGFLLSNFDNFSKKGYTIIRSSEKTMPPEVINYSPSLDFTNLQDNHSLCLTAEGDPEEYAFSVWYKRPVMRKVLFGLLGEREKMEVIDKLFSVDGAFRLLELFLRQEYNSIEKELKK